MRGKATADEARRLVAVDDWRAALPDPVVAEDDAPMTYEEAVERGRELVARQWGI